MARTLSKEHLPPGATAFAFNGQLYIPGDDGKVRNMAGQEVELPADFPSDAQLAANLKKAQGFAGSAMAPLEQTIATTGEKEDKGGKSKKSER